MERLVNNTKQQPQQRIAFQTLGCRSNFADTIDLQALIAEKGATACELNNAANVFVLNTCTVTDEADKEVLRQLKRAKRIAPEAKIIVTGCMAEVSRDELLATGLVDAVIGPGRKSELVSEIFFGVDQTESTTPEKNQELVQLPKIYPSGRRPKRSLPERKSISLRDKISPALVGPGEKLGEVVQRARYHLRVQEGCENSCTFCIIPQTRGRLSSREIEEIKRDIEVLYAKGYREIVLTGTHLGGYGEEVGQSLLGLIQELLKLDFPIRYRLSSIDPNDLSKDLIDLVAASISQGDKFAKHLHICVQAFSHRILKLMNRKYSLENVYELVEYIGQVLPGIGLGTDVICGFPGELREESESGIVEFERLQFTYLHAFPYSERAGTAATRLADSVLVSERNRRAARYRAASSRKECAFARSLIGRNVDVVLENTRDCEFGGTTSEFLNARINRPQDVERSKELQVGKIVKVQVIGVEQERNRLICDF
ncbi:radical SAM protein [bacterium]|nr:radical SAM protein [bacterium]